MSARRLAARILAIGLIALGVLLMHGLTLETRHSGHGDGHAASSEESAHALGTCCLWVISGAAGFGALLVLATPGRRAAWRTGPSNWLRAVPVVTSAGFERAPPGTHDLALLQVSLR